MLKIKCETHGELPAVKIDGYVFGDRLLEGVDFMVANLEGKPKALGVVESAANYFASLNKGMWIQACQDFCELRESKDWAPIALETANCPICGNEVEWE